MADSVVVIENFEAWRRAIKQLDAGLDREVKDAFLEIGDKVADDASTIAKAKLRVNPDGDGIVLSKTIKPKVRMKDVVIQARAKRKKGKNAPYAYPAIYEYGSGGAKAFLAPAVRKNLKFIESEFARAIEETAIKAGFR